MTAKISKNIGNANVLLTLFIIALHTIGDDYQYRCVRWLVDFSVPTFFTISSYLYFQKFELSFSFFWKKLISRFYSLYIPFIIFNALFIPYIFVKTSILHIPNTREVSMDITDLLGSIFFGYPTILNGPLWFIKALLLFVLLAPVIGYFLKKSKFFSIPLVLFGFILSFYTNYFQFLYWVPCYVLGCYFALYEKDIIQVIEETKRDAHHKLYIVVLFLLYAVISYSIIDDKPYDSFFYYCHRMIAPLWVIAIYSAYRILPNSMVQKMYPYTFFVYCTHTFFIYFSQHVLVLLIPELNIYIIKLLVFVVSTISVFLLAMVVSRIKPLWKVLNGFRTRK